MFLHLLFFGSAIIAHFSHVRVGATDCESALNPTPKDWDESLKIIEKLRGEVRTVNATAPASEKYRYTIGFCSPALSDLKNVGATQERFNSTGNLIETVPLGCFNKTELLKARDLLIVTYHNGKNFSKEHCGGTFRKATIIISCSHNKDVSNDLVAISEHGEGVKEVSDCGYFFQMFSEFVCNEAPGPESGGEEGLSTGSVLVILMLVVLAVYMSGGVMYRRIALGAKGVDQVPNYDMWINCGHLQADGCDYACRGVWCGQQSAGGAGRGGVDGLRPDGYHGVRGVDDDFVPPQHHTPVTSQPQVPPDKDDRLLPM